MILAQIVLVSSCFILLSSLFIHNISTDPGYANVLCREPRNHKLQFLPTLSHLRVRPMSTISDTFWIMVSSALLLFLLLFSTLLYHEPLRGRWRHWTGKTVQSYMAVSVIGYFYFYGCLRGKALEILGLQLFVSNVKISIILTSWKAWKTIFSLENEVASTFSLRMGILPDGLMSDLLPLHPPCERYSFPSCGSLWMLFNALAYRWEEKR